MSEAPVTVRPDTGRAALWVAGSVLALAAALVLGILVGPAGTSDWSIIWNIRAPRVALAALVGSTLSLAGASYQGVFRNPLVDPYLLGVAAGAGLGATVVFTVGRGVSEA